MMKHPVYLHIGNNYSVDLRDVVGIFDMDNTTVDKSTRRLLEQAEKNRTITYATYELPKSFIITEKNGRVRVWVSQLSASTLKKRIEAGGGI